MGFPNSYISHVVNIFDRMVGKILNLFVFYWSTELNGKHVNLSKNSFFCVSFFWPSMFYLGIFIVAPESLSQY